MSRAVYADPSCGCCPHPSLWPGLVATPAQPRDVGPATLCCVVSSALGMFGAVPCASVPPPGPLLLPGFLPRSPGWLWAPRPCVGQPAPAPHDPMVSPKKVHEAQARRWAREAGGRGGGRDAGDDLRVCGDVLLHAGAALLLLRPPRCAAPGGWAAAWRCSPPRAEGGWRADLASGLTALPLQCTWSSGSSAWPPPPASTAAWRPVCGGCPSASAGESARLAPTCLTLCGDGHGPFAAP